jgi:hypothetical protein
MDLDSVYKSWPGLANPNASEPVRFAKEILEIRCANDKWRVAKSRAYRSLRWCLTFLRLAKEEFQHATKKTLVDLAVALVAAGLAIPPVREVFLSWRPFWLAYGVLIVLGISTRLARRLSGRRLIAQRLSEVALRFQLVLDFQRKHTKDRAAGRECSKEHLRNSIENVLQAIADSCKLILQVPDGVHMHANLMIPMPVTLSGRSEPQHGCGIVAYNTNRPAGPAWTRLAWEDIGGAEAFRTGKVQVVEDTHDPIWCGVFGALRSKSFVSFPVHQDSNKVVAVVNVDATRSRVFTQKNAAVELYPVIAGPLRLLADILFNTRRTPAPGAPSPGTSADTEVRPHA